MERPQGYCEGVNMEDDLKALVRYCPFCVDYQTAGMAPRQLADTVYDMELVAEVLFRSQYLFGSDVNCGELGGCV